ncbi:MAG: glycine cleavage system aminomethyltransferase GcvT [Bacteroidales bacterium]|jgi:aminomethyltransferase|nr:glycine cleavage system aminomethyltransferase GcvT [Bacteroidales bacterium]
MKSTVFEAIHQRLGAKMSLFAGFNMPIEYQGVNCEHLAVRNGAGVFDVSHMGEISIKGPNALTLIQHITTNDASVMPVGKVQYSCMPNGKGGIVDDICVYRYEEQEYMLVVNAANIEKDWEWIQRNNRVGAELENASAHISQLAVQGPKAIEVMQKLTPADLKKIPAYSFITAPFAGIDRVIISATGYTGAGGFELYFNNADGIDIWESLFDAGKEENILPAGLAARDTLRLEKGYCLYGNDIDDTTSPIEAGLGWIVKFVDGKNFIDRELLLKQKTEGVTRKLVGIKMEEKGIPRHGYSITDSKGTEIGRITSGTMSPCLKTGIGMGYLAIDYAAPDTEVYLSVRGKSLKAKVVRFPFV